MKPRLGGNPVEYDSGAVHEKRRDLKELADLFKGEIIDVGKHHVTIILTSWPKRIDALVELARP